MTDEEMAYEYAKYDDNGRVSVNDDKFKGFLAGLNAGRPKWHKVADGDLPKHCRYGSRTSEYVLAKFKSGNTGVCYFDFYLLGWFADGYPEQFKNIIAWCEIPKFKEEEE